MGDDKKVAVELQKCTSDAASCEQVHLDAILFFHLYSLDNGEQRFHPRRATPTGPKQEIEQSVEDNEEKCYEYQQSLRLLSKERSYLLLRKLLIEKHTYLSFIENNR